MQIVITCPTLSRRGGAERCISILTDYWANKGFDITVITLWKGEHPPSYKLHQKVRVVPLNSFSRGALLSNLKSLFELRSRIKEIQPDSVVSFVGPSNIITILACIGLKPVVISERTNPRRTDISLFTKLLMSLTYPFARRLVAQTKGVISALPPLTQKKSVVIPNPLSPEIENSNISIDYEKKAIIALGRLEPVKGFDLLLEAFSHIHRKFPEWKLLIWGAGSEETNLRRQVKALNLSSAVTLNPPTPDPVSAYSCGSIFVLPSRNEGFPNALCEASALGMAVVAADCDFGPREIVRPNISGTLVPPESSKDLESALTKMIESTDLRRSLGTQAKEIRSTLKLEEIASRWESVL